MNRTHTPGPWKAGTGTTDFITAADGERIAYIVPLVDPNHEQPNALLIAAAPDLVAALRLALDGITNARRPEWDEFATVVTIHEALIKAGVFVTGTPP